MTSGVADAAQRVGAPTARPETIALAGRPLPLVGSARIYVCGITPYDVTHLGHASTFVWADLLASVLEATRIEVRSCRNVTDVDDVLLEAARRRDRYYDEFALAQEAEFGRSMRALRVAEPTATPRARHYVDSVQQLAQVLLDTGAAYERDGTVWFRGRHVPGAAGLEAEEAMALSAAYGDAPDDPAKDDPFDVAVWRPSAADQPAWPSPWGWGRPGWHAECAAMALAVQGPVVDVLVGGEDLVFPHHAYQAAMVEAATGVEAFARAALHVGEVRRGGEKMAKSTGNLVLVDDLLESCTPAALRLLLLNRRYADPWDFEPGLLPGAQDQLDGLYAAAGRTPAAGTAGAAGSEEGVEEVLGLLRADLDVPAALAAAQRRGGEAAKRLIGVLRLG